ncbi:hypothetical protein Y032_0080g1371 [Ancylostoma ceylanicum]|uniref:Uncharacterized protein n=1 Tax=Ancylostoma ceylanicum TaxID=53326 RepID=A0A016TTS9_9BILA|nr:hypothetical protein Y032_0080g1371 [Ancylostoma ceylanicum]
MPVVYVASGEWWCGDDVEAADGGSGRRGDGGGPDNEDLPGGRRGSLHMLGNARIDQNVTRRTDQPMNNSNLL